jgi:polyisoprenoid-binding protein YceI
MKKLILVSLVLFSNAALFAQTKWNVDVVHSNVRFTVVHLVISEVEGSFKTFTGSMTSTSPDFVGSSIDFSVDVNSINTDNETRDNHLKSDDFFNAEKFPKMTFKSTSFTKVSGNTYKLTGNLTLRDVTKSVTFDVTYGGTTKDGRGTTRAGFKAATVINRFDYGLKWNAMTEAGGMTVGSDVTIDIRLEFMQAK